MRSLLLTLAFTSLVACTLASGSDSGDSEPQTFRSPLSWCDLFTCEPCPSTGCPPGGEEVSYCCNSSGVCSEVGDGVTCPSGTFKVICNWGMTNVDGTFTCYDT